MCTRRRAAHIGPSPSASGRVYFATFTIFLVTQEDPERKVPKNVRDALASLDVVFLNVFLFFFFFFFRHSYTFYILLRYIFYFTSMYLSFISTILYIYIYI